MSFIGPQQSVRVRNCQYRSATLSMGPQQSVSVQNTQYRSATLRYRSEAPKKVQKQKTFKQKLVEKKNILIIRKNKINIIRLYLVLKDILAYPGQEGRRFTGETGRLHGRYSYGTSSASRQMLHNEIWAKNVALPTIIPLIERMYGSYIITGAGGDLCIPGAFEYQHLHRDALPRGEPEFKGEMAIRRMNEAIKLGLLKLKKDQNTNEQVKLEYLQVLLS